MSVAIPSLRGAIAVPEWAKNELWRKSRVVPSLDLRFADLKSLVDATTGTNLIDFTRASSGTYVDSEGVIRTATTNLLLRSEEFDNPSWSTASLIITPNDAIAPDGNQTADKWQNTSTTGVISQVTTKAAVATTYTASVWVKSNDSANFGFTIDDGTTANRGRCTFNITTGELVTENDDGDFTNTSGSITAYPDSWYRITVTTTTNTATVARFRAFFNGSGDIVYLWGAQLEQSSTVGEYIPTTSTINSAPRFDHDPTTGESLGLLVEEQRTNDLPWSENFADPRYIPILSAIGATNLPAPDGTNTATLLLETGTTGEHYIQDTLPPGKTGTVTHSVFVKAAGRNFADLRMVHVGESTATSSARVDLTTGQLTLTEGLTPATSVRAFPNGWYRVSVAVTLTGANTTYGFRVHVVSSATGGRSYAGDPTKGILVWGAQSENGSFPTSYIPTEGSAVTRAADVASISGTNFSSWYRQDEGTVFCEGAVPVGVDSSRALVSIDNGFNAERIQLRHNGTTARIQLVVDNNSIQFSASLPVNSFPSGEYRKLAMAMKANDFAAVVDDAGTVDQNSSGTMPTPTQMQIGLGPSNAQPCKPIKRITYWPARLPNETLQAITQ